MGWPEAAAKCISALVMGIVLHGWLSNQPLIRINVVRCTPVDRE